MRKISKLNKVLALALCFSVMVGTLAYFTDRVSTQATVETVDNGVDITPQVPTDPTDPSNPDPNPNPDDPTKKPEDYPGDGTPNDPTDDLTKWWNWYNEKAIGNFNPGDKMTLNYKLANTGELAVDVRETFIITSSEPMCVGVDGIYGTADDTAPEFELFTSVEKDPDTGCNTGLTRAATITATPIDSTHIKYTVAPYSLNSASETVDGVTATYADKEYYVVFNIAADNDFQGKTCTVNYVVEAKQHTDNAADWVTAATGTLTVGGQTLPVVPAAIIPTP